GRRSAFHALNRANFSLRSKPGATTPFPQRPRAPPVPGCWSARWSCEEVVPVRRTLIIMVLLALATGCVLDLFYNGIVDMVSSLFEVLDAPSESFQRSL